MFIQHGAKPHTEYRLYETVNIRYAFRFNSSLLQHIRFDDLPR